MDRHALPILALAPALAVPAGIADAQSRDQEIDALRAEVATLRELVRQDDWMTEARADQIRSLVHDVLADADTRATFLQNGAPAGYDGGFYIGNDDGTFSLKMNGQIQFRWVYNNQDRSSDDHRWGFENRRTKVKFKGNVFDDSWHYAINGAFDRSGGTSGGGYRLEEAEIMKKLDGGAYLRFGQFKGPFLREELVSSSKTLTVERSLVNEEFNQDRSQGIEYGWSGDNMRFMVMYGDGFATRNTAALTRDTEFAVMGRAELLVSGNWDQFSDYTSWSGDEQGILVGAAFAYDKEEYGTVADIDEAEVFRWTIDGSLEFGGANVAAYFTGRHSDNETSPDTDEYGFVVQGGMFFVPDEWEFFARYEWGDDDTTAEDLSVITVGVNRYWNRHGLKWTTDIGFGVDEVDATWATSGAGYRADTTNEDGQVVLRSQFQLLF